MSWSSHEKAAKILTTMILMTAMMTKSMTLTMKTMTMMEHIEIKGNDKKIFNSKLDNDK